MREEMCRVLVLYCCSIFVPFLASARPSLFSNIHCRISSLDQNVVRVFHVRPSAFYYLQAWVFFGEVGLLSLEPTAAE